MGSGGTAVYPGPAERGRRTVAAATAAGLTSICLYPVFSGSAWWWAGTGAALTIAGAGTLTRLRRLPVLVCLLSGLAGLLLYLNLLFAHGRSLAGVVPTPASLGYLANLAGQGIADAGRFAPPVPELSGMVLLAAGGIGLTALLVDLIAVRLGSAALAGVPLLLLFTEPFTLSVSRGSLGTAMVFCLGAAGYLTLLATEGGERIRAWGQPRPGSPEAGVSGDGIPRSRVPGTGVPRSTGVSGSGVSGSGVSRGRRPDTGVLAAAGRRVGFASVVVALFVPVFIPGLHVTRLFGTGGPGIGGAGGAPGVFGFPDPQTQVTGELRSTRATPVLRYTSTTSDPDYLQVYVLSDLTAGGWQLSHHPQSLIRGDGAAFSPPGLTSPGAAQTVSTRITIGGQPGQDAPGALPAPYPPLRVAAPGAVQADPGTLMLFDHGVSLAGLRYSVSSLSVVPSAQALAAAAAAPEAVSGEYRDVPRSYAGLRTLAGNITQGATTPYAKAVALQDWFADGNFTYALSAPTIANAASLENFLDNTRAGYCQQFAYAMAVLARLDGIPSRIAYGFTQGAWQTNGGWLVTTHDAHAWPELYFAGYGWLRFEPTPGGPAGQGTAITPSYAASRPGSVSPGQEGQQPAPATTAGPFTGGQNSQATLHGRQLLRQGGAGGTALPVQSPAGGLNPWELAGLAVTVLLILAAVAPALARAAIRRRRWSKAVRLGRQCPRPLGNAALADAAWKELRDDLTDYGAGSPASESPRALACRVTETLELSAGMAGALGRVTMAAERARYSARPADGTTLRQDSAAVRRALAASASRRGRWLARAFPRSVTVRAATVPWTIAALIRGKKDRLTRRRVRLSHESSAQDDREPVAVRP